MDLSWKKEKPVDFHTFREKLAKQMLSYSPQHRKYPGDEKFRLYTRQPKAKRRHANISSISDRNSSASSLATATSTHTNLTREVFNNNKKRLCGDLSALYCHVASIKPTDSSGRICVVCGKRCYTVCVACGEAMHRYPKKGTNDVPCFYHHHNTSFFGLSKKDATLAGTRIKDWAFPTQTKMDRHRSDIHKTLEPRVISLPPITPRPQPIPPPVPPLPPPLPPQELSSPVRHEEVPINPNHVI